MKAFKEELQEFLDICEYMKEMEDTLLYHSDLDREDAYKRLYDKAFSDEINGRLQQIYPFDWCCIDAGYDDDYLDWKRGLWEATEEVKKMLGVDKNSYDD